MYTVQEGFSNIVDIFKDKYTLTELKQYLTDAYKLKNKKEAVKKEPSAYNIFFKEEFAKIKSETPDLDNKEYMRLIGTRWKAKKGTVS
jgi:hypothetical protein